MTRLSPKSISYTLFLSAAVALGPLSTDMYLPTFPLLAEVFNASVADVQLTLSVFTFGIAACQLFYGPLADRYGRKPVLVVGLLLYAVACYGCLIAVTIDELILFRFLQALGVCAAIVIPRAMVRDLFAREQAAKQLSRMGTIMGLAPAIAPVIGGYLAIIYGWHAIFLFLGTVGLVVMAVVVFLIDESHQAKDKNALHPRHILRNYSALLRHREFMSFALAGGFCFAGLFAFISGSPLVLIEFLGVAADNFGYFFGMTVLGFMTGTVVGPVLTNKGGLVFALKMGTLVSAGGGFLMLMLALISVDHVAAVVGPMIIYVMGLGIVLPQSQAGAMAPFPEKAGAAAALMGFLMLGFAALLGYLMAVIYDETQMVMVSAIALMGCLSALVFWATSRHASA